ncbi:L-serine dehydratase 1 [Serratia fonticola]|uniref:L-serine ammonia-lyase n=1 Tax=Serratia fonticola TaxID=47917 RepID=A0A4U9W348_SERFO|nr:L-serine dehydratase 1 [Serratia fonticola]
MISVFDMFKIGIGPSSSHTVGPMKAGKQFVDDLVNEGLMPSVTRVAVDVYGSLSLTGKRSPYRYRHHSRPGGQYA